MMLVDGKKKHAIKKKKKTYMKLYFLQHGKITHTSPLRLERTISLKYPKKKTMNGTLALPMHRSFSLSAMRQFESEWLRSLFYSVGHVPYECCTILFMQNCLCEYVMHLMQNVATSRRTTTAKGLSACWSAVLWTFAIICYTIPYCFVITCSC